MSRWQQISCVVKEEFIWLTERDRWEATITTHPDNARVRILRNSQEAFFGKFPDAGAAKGWLEHKFQTSLVGFYKEDCCHGKLVKATHPTAG